MKSGKPISPEARRSQTRKKEVDHSQPASRERDIAIVGMACHFPDAPDHRHFWRNLARGVNSIKEIPQERWALDYYSTDFHAPEKSVSKWCGLLDRIDQFDNRFFNISPREAKSMDPQQRLLLEETWHCIEDSCIPLARLQEERTAVLVGVMASDYQQESAAADVVTDSYAALGGYDCILANRISFVFGLVGPSLSIGAACASSLVAIDRAKNYLLQGDADYALAAGVSLNIHPWKNLSFSKSRMFSPEGQCKTFDIDANGYVPGDGVGVLLMQTLGDALAQDNRIYGILKGSAVNHGGKAASITAPRVQAQRSVILDACRDAEINPETITYLEAHGTGTSLGDPIEVEAASQAYRQHTQKQHYCHISSVKTNIGHLEAAAGIAGAIKVLLMMRHRQIPAILNLKTLNPIIPFDGSPFKVPRELTAWEPARDTAGNLLPLRAGVSSFGFGGANAHCLLEEFREEDFQRPPIQEDKHLGHLFLLSATSIKSLRAIVDEWRLFSRTEDFQEVGLRDLCASLLISRENHSYRLGIYVATKDELVSFLNTPFPDPQKSTPNEWCMRIGNCRWTGYERVQDLLKRSAPFGRNLDDLLPILRNFKGVSRGFRNKKWPEKHRILYGFIVNLALSRSLIEQGFQPSSFSAEGSGWWASLCLAGMLDVETCMARLLGEDRPLELKRPYCTLFDPVFERKLLPLRFTQTYLRALTESSAVEEETLRHYVERARLLITNQYTFKRYMEEWLPHLAEHQFDLYGLLNDDGLMADETRRLERCLLVVVIKTSLKQLNRKWHLSMPSDLAHRGLAELIDLVVDKVLSKAAALKLVLGKAEFNQLALGMGKDCHRLKISDRPYVLLRQQNVHLVEVEQPVEWLTALLAWRGSGEGLGPCLELGALQQPSEAESSVSDPDSFYQNLVLGLWREGVNFTWRAWYPQGSFNGLRLPAYVFDRRSFWLDKQHTKPAQISSDQPEPVASRPPEPLRGNTPNQQPQDKVSSAKLNEDILNPTHFSRIISPEDVIIKDTVVLNHYIVPSTLRLEMALNSARRVSGKNINTLSNLLFQKPGIMGGEDLIDVNINPETSRFILHSNSGNICQGSYSEEKLGEEPLFNPAESCRGNHLAGEEVYKNYVAWGYSYGPTLQLIEELWHNSSAFIARLRSVAGVEGLDTGLCPHLLDCVFQSIFQVAHLIGGVFEDGHLYVPFTIKFLSMYEHCDGDSYVVMPRKSFHISEEKDIRLDYRVYDHQGHLRLDIKDMLFKRVDNQFLENSLQVRSKLRNLQDLRGPMNDYVATSLDQVRHLETGMGQVETFGHYRLLAVFQQAGLFAEADKTYRRDELTAHLDLIPKYNRMFDALMEMVTRIGWVETQGETIRVTPAVSSEETQTALADLEERKVRICETWPDMVPFINLLDVAVSNYIDLFAGKKTHIQVLFPKGSGALWEFVYKGNALSDFFNSCVTTAITKRIESLRRDDPNRVVRIVEIGSGTGGTSAMVLEALKPYAAKLEYFYTDIGLSFVNFGKKTFGPQYPFAQFKVLDVEKDVLKQGFQLQAFDIAFETNCIHAVSDLRNSTQEIKKLLTQDGMLVINEISRLQDFWTFVAGLIDGWWLYKDPELRIPHSPLLSYRGWADLFREQGFTDFLGADPAREKTYEQAVLLCFSDGVVDVEEIEDRAEPTAAGTRTALGNDALMNQLHKLFADTLQMSQADFDVKGDFSEYGIDSMVSLEVIDRLESLFGELPKTLMFEYMNLESLAGYFRENHAQRVAQRFPSAAQPSSPAAEPLPQAPPAAPDPTTTREQTRPVATEDMAIIGIAGRYAQSADLNQLWENLIAGRDCVTEVPAHRWDWRQFAQANDGQTYTRHGGFMDDFDKFDALFFNIAPKVAELMDPQQRIFLETVWATIEDAGYTRKTLGRSVGVFAGVTTNTYGLHGLQQSMLGNTQTPDVDCYDIANRVSYFFDFKGPSLAVDSACSSSLTTVHLACEAIRREECDLAVAGGVSLTLHPNRIIQFCTKNMLSKDGKSRTFGQGADGFVDGEGVGSILLKPLAKAITDKDNIHAIIKGSFINTGGRTSGYTVPNPNAHAELIDRALARAGVSARDISYIEAHGTGTSLGDPIEIKGLTQSHRKAGNDRHYCAVGSVKTNIGHTIAAAGIAGLTKVLLQMRYQTLVPSLHAQETNPFIDFSNSPFYLQRTRQEWQTSDGKPRRAGVSSFGAGGANAHVILEEYPTASSQPDNGPALVVLSAKTRESLRGYAQRLGTFVLKSISTRTEQAPLPGPDVTLQDIAYTLQVGREAFKHRLAMIVASKDDLCETLATWLGGGDCENLYEGTTARGRRFTIVDDEDGRIYLRSLISKGKLMQIAGLWSEGTDVDWSLMQNQTGRRISLPAYAFARERYWLPEVEQPRPENNTAKLHPLLDANCSTFQEQAFRTGLHPNAFYLADHVVAGRTLLPGVIGLEMARAAAQHSIGTDITSLRNVVWRRPLEVSDQPLEIRTVLKPTDQGKAEFQIGDGAITGEITYDQPLAGANREYLETLRSHLGPVETADAFYKRLEAAGLQHGPRLQSVCTWQGHGSDALAELVLPPGSSGGFHLHPAIADGALQSAVRLLLEKQPCPWMTFSLGEAQFLRPTPDHCFVRVTLKRNEGDCVFDVVILDDSGHEVVRFRGFVARPDGRGNKSLDSTDSHLHLSPTWQNAQINTRAPSLPTPVLLLGDAEPLHQALRHSPKLIRVGFGPSFSDCGDGSYKVDPTSADHFSQLLTLLEARDVLPKTVLHHLHDGDIADESQLRLQLESGPYAWLNLTRALLKHRQDVRLLCLMGHDAGDLGPVGGGLPGFARTLRLENPQFRYQCIGLDQNLTGEALLELIQTELQAGEELVRYRNGVRERAFLAPADLANQGPPVLRDGGVYLITGGAAGIGFEHARFLAEHYATRLVLCGRRAQDANVQDRLQELQKLGGLARYVQADVSRRDEVTRLVNEVHACFGPLNGVIHAAGVNRDSFVLEKTNQQMEDVLGPKVFGTVFLDEATRGDSLDFFVLFSSLAALMGNMGQSDYAFANGFMDHFAVWRAKSRPGCSLAINWPLWAEGGMAQALSSKALADFEKTWGMKPLDAQVGLATFRSALRAGRSRHVVVQGNRQRILQALAHTPTSPIPTRTDSLAGQPPGMDTAGLRSRTSSWLAACLAEEIKLPVERVQTTEPMENYGIDSVMILSLNKRLEADFGQLSKTLFFEYQTIDDLTSYFMKTFPQQLAARFAHDSPPVAAESKPVNPSLASTLPTAQRVASGRPNRFEVLDNCRSNPMPQSQPVAPGNNPVAIVGLAGRYPQAPTPDIFWKNLVAGRDCISEIPAERWNHETLFSTDKNEKGKIYTRWGGFIENPDAFDARFFNIAPREAQIMDPQERLFLETSWQAVEDAGYTRKHLAQQRVGVYAGVMWSEYQLYGNEETLKGHAMAVSSSFASIANRVSYLMNLSGPSIGLDTMCSSSLTAIHLACSALRVGEIDAAIAGGVNVSIHPNKYLYLSQGRFASSRGRCGSFGEGGDGYVPGEGVGAVLLKTLAQAINDGEHIYGIIRSSAVNHGGKTHGFTVPNPNAQGALIGEALHKAGIDPHTISYLEAHGTGTTLGDPVEITGLEKAFAPFNLRPASIPVGSVKSNIGHLESAAGIAALTKVLLQMKHRCLVPSIHSGKLNPNINFAESPFYVQQQVSEWTAPHGQPRRAGISSFGAGGSNAHLIVEEWQPGQPAPTVPGSHVVPVSASNEAALLRNVRALRTSLGQAATTAPAIAQQVLDLVAQVIGVPVCEIDRDEPLVDYGYDPTLVSQLLQKVGECFHTEIDGHVESATQLIQRISATRVSSPEQTGLLPVLAYTLQHGREAMRERLALVVSSRAELAAGLDAWLAGEQNDYVFRYSLADNPPPVSETPLSGSPADMAQAWVEGRSVLWPELPSGPRRISLPPYQFERKRHWLPVSPVPQAAAVLPPEPIESQVGLWLAQWQPAPIDRPDQAQGPFLVLDSDPQTGARLGSQYPSQPVVLVQPGQAFYRRGPFHYEINPLQADHYQQLIATLKEDELLPRTLLLRSSDLPLADHLIQAHLQRGFYAVLYLVQALIAEGPGFSARLLYDYLHDGTRPLDEAMAGFARTLALEHPALQLRVVGHSATTPLPLAELDATDVAPVRYHNGQRLKRGFARLDTAASSPAPLKADGVYLITGGAGGLGLLFAHYLTERGAGTIVLSGRSQLDPNKSQALKRLTEKGARAHYRPCDITDRTALTALLAELRQFGPLSGVIHAAGVLNDALLCNKQAQQASAVLAPKVYGAVHLDELTQHDPLQFFALFSSLAGVVGNRGQADYAYANRFLDGFAETRASRQEAGQRHGVSLSIAWPLWHEGGMGVDARTEAALLRDMGMTPLETANGFEAFEQGLQQGGAVSVFQGQTARFEERLLAQPPSPSAPVAAVESADLLDQLKVMVGNILDYDITEIRPGAAISDLGFDSISFTEFADSMNSSWGLDMTPALLYGIPSLNDLVDWLQKHHAEHLTPASVVPLPRPLAANEPIAIIGMAGVLPGSQDLEAFWQNLEEARDLISEAPPERWDWRAFHGDTLEPGNHTNVPWAGFLNRVDQFDADFFGISRREAEQMDPQQRIYLQLVWQAIEDGGYNPLDLAGSSTAVLAGIGSNDYHELLAEQGFLLEAHSITGKAHSILPNRISWLLDLKGPSEPVDTACSSSLVAVQRAVDALRSGVCDLAIAGGVNLIISPKLFISIDKAGMLSKDGRCKTFDAAANGYVRGEGAGALLLKPLGRAEADGDPIHAVIRGAAVNHGGRSASLTAPNPKAQAELIVAAMENAGVSPNSISYIETHGTGTSLGDPIEIDGLRQAFQTLYQRNEQNLPAVPHCGLGSVKSNLGHLEVAAGIAGLFKLILAMKHQRLPASLHVEKVNPYVRLQDSPFRIITSTEDWPTTQGQPRRAGISSFGFGGVNAHLVLEEYQQRPQPTSTGERLPFVFSAKSKVRLRANLIKMRDYLKTHYPDPRSMAYTLAVGRQGMPVRCAFQAATLAELTDLIDQWFEGHIQTMDRPDLIAWCAGDDLDWRSVFAPNLPTRLHLPGYAFAPERFWLPLPAEPRSTRRQHPLLDANVSNLDGLAFAATLRRNHVFLRDHVVNDQHILPGAAYLEMTRAAASIIAGKTVSELRDIVWEAPGIAGQNALDLEVRLGQGENMLTAAVIGDSGQHATLSLHFESIPKPKTLDLDAIKQRCTEIKPGEECYASYAAMGLRYGPSFQTIQQLASSGSEALSRLCLPRHLCADRTDYILHPSLIDGALQTVSGLLSQAEMQGETAFVPFALESLCIYNVLPTNGYAHVTRVPVAAKSPVKKFNIQIADDRGNVAVGLNGFSLRAYTKSEPPLEELKQERPSSEIHYFEPVWKTEPAPRIKRKPTLVIGTTEWPENSGHVYLSLAETTRQLDQSHWLVNPHDALGYTHVLKALAAADNLPQQMVIFGKTSKTVTSSHYLSLFQLFRALDAVQSSPRLIYVYEGSEPCHAAMGGFLRSLRRENQQLQASMLCFQGVPVDPAIIQAELSAFKHDSVRYTSMGRQVLRYQTTQLTGIADWRKGQTWLITGGAGGLGLIFARALAAAGINLALLGRSPASDRLAASLEPLRRDGAGVAYFAADVTHREQLRQTLDQVRKRFGRINGVIHAAGEIRDCLFADKKDEDLLAVARPKLEGLQNLDEATSKDQLQHFVLCSAAAAIAGNPGQTDYALANAYMDAFAAQRTVRVALGTRWGNTLSVNWPLWANGGMNVDEETRKTITRQTGLRVLHDEAGLTALRTMLNSGRNQLIPAPGEPDRIETFLNFTITPTTADSSANGGIGDFLSSVFAKALKADPLDLDRTRAFQEYGIDSFLTLSVERELEKTFGNLSKTLLFEYQTIDELSQYFSANHSDKVQHLFGGETRCAACHETRVSVEAHAFQEKVAKQVEATDSTFRVVRVERLKEHPELKRIVAGLFADYRSEGSVSRGTRNIAPFLFICADRGGYFNFNRNDRTMMVYAYTGPEQHRLAHLAEMVAYSQAENLPLSILSETPLTRVGETTFSATPMGASQRITNLSAFSLKGNKMRRLRYLVQKFETGGVETREYSGPDDPQTNSAILAVLDAWTATKTQVNPLIGLVRREIERGLLRRNHRVFLTYRDNRLMNVIVISALAHNSGYLMDLEFYASDMPLGGLEAAICRIIRQLVDEGCPMLSLGGTFGPKIIESENADRQVEAILDRMRDADDFGAGNLQFKNKFRTQNTPVYLCRPLGADPGTATDIFMMIADPANMEMEEDVQQIAQDPRWQVLAESGCNPMNLASDQVDFDLKTDSWAQLETDSVRNHIKTLQGSSRDPLEVVSALFPFQHHVLFASGRMAEAFFFDAIKTQTEKRIVAQNLLFPTWIFHQLEAGFQPVELPDPRVLEPDNAYLFKGGLDKTRLEQILNQGQVAFVVVELCNNASGGYPVSLAELRALRELTQNHDTALILDATRIVENATFIARCEEGIKNRDIGTIISEICSLSDGLTASLCKDFGLDVGGLLATNNAALANQIKAATASRGSGLNARDRSLIAAALENRTRFLNLVQVRMQQVERLWHVLDKAGAAPLGPHGGHCLLLDVAHMSHFAECVFPRAAFCAWLAYHTGVRAGNHNAGMQRGTRLNTCVRLAVPVGLSQAQVDALAQSLDQLFTQMPPAPELRLEHRPDGFMGEAMARYSAGKPMQPMLGVRPPVEQPDAEEKNELDLHQAIAIIGMSGRYPMAPDPASFWQNLRQGRNCITEIPQQRWDSRRHYDPEAEKPGCKWGGFLEDLDRFDPLFFGIAPNAAPLVAPRERLLLETVWHTMEDAGYTRQGLSTMQEKDRVGMFVGCTHDHFTQVPADPGKRAEVSIVSNWSVANRLSHFFDLRGPSLAVDTACSSSAAAVHLAMQSIQAGTSVMAFAGGVNLNLHPDKYIGLGKGGALGSEALSRSLGGGDGYLPGEGVGMLLLKKLDNALADKDYIHGLILAAEADHGGATSSYMLPNPTNQEHLFRRTLHKAGIAPETLTYIEAAANGSPVADKAEMDALAGILANQSGETCYIGSVKPNIGHLEGASAMSQITKVLLQMKHGLQVATINSLPTQDSCEWLRIRAQNASWPRPVNPSGMVPRRAMINSFGAGGANVCLVLQEWPEVPPEPTIKQPLLMVFSARDEERLKVLLEKMTHFLEDDVSLRDLSFTLLTGREPMKQRLAMVVEERGEMVTALRQLSTGQTVPNLWQGRMVGRDWQNRVDDKEVQKWFRVGNLAALGEAWAKGAQINWPAILPKTVYADARRMPLPTYPFARQSYWPETERVMAEKETAAPLVQPILSGTLHQKVAAIWREVLGVALLEPDDGFFELGGDSLSGTRVLSRLRQVLALEVELVDLLSRPCLSDFIDWLEQQKPEAEVIAGIAPVSRAGQLPLSFAQQRLWFLYKSQPKSPAFNIPVEMDLKGPLDRPALQRAFAALIARHESLRTSFPSIGQEPIQKIHRLAWSLPIIDISDLEPGQRDAVLADLIRGEGTAPFVLETGPLFRLTLLGFTPEHHVLLFTMHHIITDFWSYGVLFAELGQLYAGYVGGESLPLAPLPIQYADFAVWQRSRETELEAQLAYWRDHLQGAPDTTRMSGDKKDSHPRGAVRAVVFSQELTSRMENACKQQEVTPFIFLLTCFNLLLRHRINRDDLVIGTDVANRNRPELEGMVGFFINQLVLRNDLSGNASLTELLKRVQKTAMDAYAHQDLPFDRLVGELRPSRDTSPFFQMKLVLQNTPQTSPNLSGVHITEKVLETGQAKMDIQINLQKRENRLEGELHYRADMFEAATIAHLMRHYEILVETCATSSEFRTDEVVSLLAEADRAHEEKHLSKVQKSGESRFKKRARRKVKKT